ncbi:hypothetical protein StoSoilA2_03710 [Arthrobacter sp. StoSoilA2]|uniref:DUF6318 family protein n=1 Tax=Arthrobacter sp. StoSoilA2 TaxID=2830990 RepID=UPI001CC5F9FF|nr:DUF6318 family protein [Arthrobacter sp. StoSoilA2]BCW34315.1 hypothetical protein StoSoilA2_03710 [Arthrobacter sp. StoSoilA2]
MTRLSFASFTVLIVRVAAAALGLSLLLTGCQGGCPPSKPSSETGPTTASPTSGASGSPSADGPSATTAPSGVYKPADAKGKAQNVPVPVMPELAKENSKEGLEAFIRYWYAQQNYAIETGDSSSWKRLTAPDCRACNRIQEGIDDSNVDGRWLAGGKITVPVVEPLWTDNVVGQQAKVQVIQQRADYFNADGTTGRAFEKATNSAFGLSASFGPNGWTVADLGLIG